MTLGERARAWVLAVGATGAASACLLGVSTASAQERPTLSGQWSATGMSERWNIGDWGEACGPKPAPRGAGGGGETITESGGELNFSGGGYARTNTCFESGFGVQSHSASPRFWRTRCGTSANDPRRATLVTTVQATDNAINFDETGEYQFILKEQNCTASVRRTRSYSLVKRLGEEPPPPPPTQAPPPPPPPTPEPPKETEKPLASCDSPGEASRVEVRPSRKVLKPGESFQLRAVLLDANGCRVAQSLTWSAPGAESRLSVSPTGLVAVAPEAAEGELSVSAGVNGRAAKVVIEIVSPDRYAKLLAGGTLAAAESEDAAIAVVATASLGGGPGIGEDGSRRRRLMFLAVVGACVTVLGVAGIVLMRRTKREVEEVEELIPGETKMTVVRKKRLVKVERPPPPTAAAAPASPAPQVGAKGALCPTCKRIFSAGSAFCPDDGARLTDVSAAPSVVAGLPTTSGPSHICPVCGSRYDGVTTFCGKDGSRLVLVN